MSSVEWFKTQVCSYTSVLYSSPTCLPLSQSYPNPSDSLSSPSTLLSAPNGTVKDGALYQICHRLGAASSRPIERKSDSLGVLHVSVFLNTSSSTAEQTHLSDSQRKHTPAVKTGPVSVLRALTSTKSNAYKTLSG